MFEDFKVPTELIPSDPRFASGPSLVPVKHLTALAETGTELMGTSHRKPAVKELVGEVISGLKKYFNAPEDYMVALGNGGATLLFDMIGLGMVENKSSHFTCGEFSEKWFKSHKNIPWIEAQNHNVEYGKGVTPESVDGADYIAMTLNETSTGVQLADVQNLRKDGVLVGVDATSGAGQVEFDLSLCDMFFFSPQKVFASDGGLWVSFLSPAAVERSKKIAEMDRYIPEIMSWDKAISNSLKNQTYNTPSIATVFLLNEQIKLMNELGSQKVYEMAAAKAKLIYDWAESKEYLSPFVSEEKFRSQAVATIDIDDKYPVADLVGCLRSQKAVYDIDGYRKLGRNQIRISLFHNITYEDLEKLTKIISLMIEG